MAGAARVFLLAVCCLVLGFTSHAQKLPEGVGVVEQEDVVHGGKEAGLVVPDEKSPVSVGKDTSDATARRLEAEATGGAGGETKHEASMTSNGMPMATQGLVQGGANLASGLSEAIEKAAVAASETAKKQEETAKRQAWQGEGEAGNEGREKQRAATARRLAEETEAETHVTPEQFAQLAEIRRKLAEGTKTAIDLSELLKKLEKLSPEEIALLEKIGSMTPLPDEFPASRRQLAGVASFQDDHEVASLLANAIVDQDDDGEEPLLPASTRRLELEDDDEDLPVEATARRLEQEADGGEFPPEASTRRLELEDDANELPPATTTRRLEGDYSEALALFNELANLANEESSGSSSTSTPSPSRRLREDSDDDKKAKDSATHHGPHHDIAKKKEHDVAKQEATGEAEKAAMKNGEAEEDAKRTKGGEDDAEGDAKDAKSGEDNAEGKDDGREGEDGDEEEEEDAKASGLRDDAKGPEPESDANAPAPQDGDESPQRMLRGAAPLRRMIVREIIKENTESTVAKVEDILDVLSQKLGLSEKDDGEWKRAIDWEKRAEDEAKAVEEQELSDDYDWIGEEEEWNPEEEEMVDTRSPFTRAADRLSVFGKSMLSKLKVKFTKFQKKVSAAFSKKNRAKQRRQEEEKKRRAEEEKRRQEEAEKEAARQAEKEERRDAEAWDDEVMLQQSPGDAEVEETAASTKAESPNEAEVESTATTAPEKAVSSGPAEERKASGEGGQVGIVEEEGEETSHHKPGDEWKGVGEEKVGNDTDTSPVTGGEGGAVSDVASRSQEPEPEAVPSQVARELRTVADAASEAVAVAKKVAESIGDGKA